MEQVIFPPYQIKFSKKMPENDNSLMWIEKYRPHELTDLLSHTEIISTIQRLIEGGKLPHLLLYVCIFSFSEQ